MTFLLDTNVISETRLRVSDAGVLTWLETVDQADLYLSVLTLGELAKGIARKRLKDPAAADSLEHWRLGIVSLFSDRIVPVDVEIASVWGELNAKRPLPVIDALLAATALAKGMTLVTRNTKDVAGTGVATLNPWQAGSD